MRRVRWSLLVVGLAVGIFVFVLSEHGIERAMIVAVVDGDTVRIDNGETVRLLGIDAPEYGEPCFAEAYDEFRNIVAGKSVLLIHDREDRDRYGRLLRYLEIDGALINLLLVQRGVARAEDFGHTLVRSAAFREAEQSAQSERIGCLWQ